ncbi:MAG: 2-amino-4-hydroxy-6-hydroxymethyldihydropteridine diphosphokinase [Endomicrobium sp.]|jgi:2-amino-4-hydroxy-6-hydroxymethyldihydropteridine diphosphokinase|nr:2-amino-4-hydroxy-6-hydroxymethyldihydropteridine diphosphokinase [Endomicrobium sp.]
MKKTVYLSLGSNTGNRAENIISALSFLQSSLFLNIKKISSFYETSPVGPRQRSFYNIAIEAQTDLKPDDLLLLVKQAEYVLGRRKTIRWGPRVVDIDILFFGREIIDEASLTVPHKEAQNRLFVLVPLSEIAGNFVHPVLRREIRTILYDKSLTLKCQKVKIIQINIAQRDLKNRNKR